MNPFRHPVPSLLDLKQLDPLQLQRGILDFGQALPLLTCSTEISLFS